MTIDALQWLAEHGAAFVPVYPPNANVENPGKRPIGDEWQQRPFSLAQITEEVARGNSVGLLTGAPSQRLGLLDVDRLFLKFLKKFPRFATTPRIIRRDAPDKAKLLIRVTEDVASKKWRPVPADSPYLEWLYTGNQGVIPPSIHPEGEPYELEYAAEEIPELTPTELDTIWLKWTREHLIEQNAQPRGVQRQSGAKGHDPELDRLKDEIRNRFDLVAYACQRLGTNAQRNGREIRILGQGGMLVDGHKWNTFGEDGTGKVGGDCFSLVAYLKDGSTDLTGARFWEALRLAADFTGVPIPSEFDERPAPEAGTVVDTQTGEILAAPAEEKPKRKRERPKSTDYIKALASLGYTFRMNECNDSIECNGEQLTDALRAKIRTEMRDLGFEYVHVMEDVCITYAYQNRYHPIKEYLNGLEWDGEDHIEHLAAGHLFDQHDPIHYGEGLTRSVTHAWLLRWMIGAVAKVFDNEQNMMLVLDGKQDMGKSHFVRWLGSPMPGYFVEGPVNPDDKDTALRLIASWIWEVAELGSTTRRADRESLKHAITAKEWTVRPPYGRNDIKKPALASMIGTINNEAGFLNDPTGNRRFLVATLQTIDWEYSDSIDVNQVWAQAVALYRSGEPVRLLPAEKAMQRLLNGGYELDDPMEDWLNHHFEITGEPDDFLATAEIVDLLQTRGMRGTTKALSMQFSATALRLGLTKSRANRTAPRGYAGIRVRPITAPTSHHQVGATNGRVHAEEEVVF